MYSHASPHAHDIHVHTNDKQVEGSIYLFALINPEYQNFLITLQKVISNKLDSLGGLPFSQFRAFRTLARSADGPFRFVDGEVIEQFLHCDSDLQEEIVEEMQDVRLTNVDEVTDMIEALRRLH